MEISKYLEVFMIQKFEFKEMDLKGAYVINPLKL